MENMLLEYCCEIIDSMRVPITASDRKKDHILIMGQMVFKIMCSFFYDELVLLAEDGENLGSKERSIAYRVSDKC